MSWPPRVALVTGASSGLGWALSRQLAALGSEVLLAARREELLQERARVIERAGGRAHALVMDVADCHNAAERVAALDAQHGGLDLIVACAGVGPADTEAPGYRWSNLAAACHTNFCGAAATLTGALDAMVARGRGQLVGICSLSAFGALPGSAAYCAPKAGLAMLLDCLRLDLAPHGVAVTAVHAGFIDTPMVAHRREAMPQLLSPAQAAQRILAELPSRPAAITFPQPLALAARAAAALPRPLRDRLVRALVDG